MIRTVREFASKHRAKLIGALVVGIGGVAWYMLSSEENGNGQPLAVRSGAGEGTVKGESRARKRARILVVVRRQYSSYAMHFLPTLKLKINEVVDVNNAVRKIKEIRSNNGKSSGDSSVDIEARLWNEIKVSSITILFVTVYMESIVCTLLRILLHVVAAYTSERESNGELKDVNEVDVEVLEKLISATYSKIYDAGLKNLTQLVRQGVAKEMEDWVVREKMDVRYDEFIAKLCALRTTFEQDTQSLVNVLSISPENNDPELLGTSSEVKPAGGGKMNGNGSESPAKKAGGKERSDEIVNELMCRTWDIVDSHVFQSIFNEAVSSAFKHVNQCLRDDVFSADSPTSGGGQRYTNYRTPPLASLLPQMKSIAARMLPDVDKELTAEAKAIADGPILNALCEAILDETCAL